MIDPIVVLGAGGTGLLMAETVQKLGQGRFSGFLDDDPEKNQSGYEGHPVLGSLQSWSTLPTGIRFLLSLYSPKRNPTFMRLIEKLGIPNDRWATIVDPSAEVSGSSVVEAGAYVGPRCVVEPRSVVGPCASLLGAVYLAHHSRLGRFVCCTNNVAIAGRCSVGDAAFLGVNCSVREGTVIGERAIVGMGAVVIRDVPDDATVVGNPARSIGRFGEEDGGAPDSS